MIARLLAAAAALLLALAVPAGAGEPVSGLPRKLVVVSDANYPPYLFRDAKGNLHGILRDKWDLWSRATGVPVALLGVEWSDAQQMVQHGTADVIDTLSFTKARANLYEFSRGRSTIEARVFFHRTLGGVHDVASLRGLAVGAKEGSACGEWLRARGVNILRTYPDSRELVQAAGSGELRLFCMDAPTARYLLVEQGLHGQFRESPPLYETTFHWAVRRGEVALRDAIERGFGRVAPKDLEAVDARWLGTTLEPRLARSTLTGAGVTLAILLAGLAGLAFSNRCLGQRARRLQTRDRVTDLRNRAWLHEALGHAIAKTGKAEGSLAVMVIDLDRFHAVNDAFGPRFGDRVLAETARRLRACVPPEALLACLGGDEFVVVPPRFGHAEDAGAFARRLLAALQGPYELDGGNVYCSASAGIAIHPADGSDAATLVRNAGIAAARAKMRGGNAVQYFLPEMHTEATRRLELETALRGALGRREFVLHYQPRVAADTGAVQGFEALLRWLHPERGLLAPAQFIGVLEETGAIAAVGEWALREACEQVLRWSRAGFRPVPVAVNLSPTQLHHRSLDAAVARVIAETGIDPALIELELTESSLMSDPEEAARILQRLAVLGIHIAIDDFGTGYSSLAHLRRFPLDALKIDRSFVRDATTNRDDASIIRAIIQLAHSLGLRVVAEGVETAEQRELLLGMGCDEMQGYYFGRPRPATDAGELLAAA